MREFKTAARTVEREEFTFMVDDVECKTVRPSEGQIAMIVASEASSVRNESEKIADMIDFSMALFDLDTRRYLTRRLMDPEDNFEFDTFMEITRSVVEDWANRPTKPSSDSTPSSENGGTSSTAGVSPKELASSS